MRIAVISLGHPEFSAGGAETASYNLYQGYRDDPGVEEAFYLARIDRKRPPTGGIGWYRGNEYFWEQAMHDWTFLRGVARGASARSLTSWLEFVRPDVVHAHHYAHLGLEMFRVIRNALPKAKIYLTLHEYMAICQNNGQMIKTGSTRLCRASSLEACGQCFPDMSREDIWLRKNFIQNHFAVIDGFFAPSHFLKQRYVDWGLPADKITVVENSQVDHGAVVPRPIDAGAARNRFGYFGQVNRFKGVDVLLQAFEQATRKDDVSLYLEVHGANLEAQAEEFQKKIAGLRETLEARGVLQWVGAYEPEDLPRRMAQVDWVVMPSIWWENSPMIIQEAFSCGRPVICSGIGGMAEKVRDGVDGMHVEVGNVLAWADALKKAGRDAEAWGMLAGNVSKPDSSAVIATRHLALPLAVSDEARPLIRRYKANSRVSKMRIVAVTMQKDETQLLDFWVAYHGELLGYENLLILDNGSVNVETLRILEAVQRLGVRVLPKNDPMDFERKGVIVSDLIESEKHTYDWVCPLDIDEMLVLEVDGRLSSAPEDIFGELERAASEGKPVLRILRSYWNIPQTAGAFPLPHWKTIVRTGSGIRLDMGYHLYSWDTHAPTIDAANFAETRIGHVHFHNRYFSDLLFASRQKLRLRVPDFSRETLRNYRGAGRHFCKYFEMSEQDYYKGFPEPKFDLGNIGLAAQRQVPFSTEAPVFTDDMKKMLFDEANPDAPESILSRVP